MVGKNHLQKLVAAKLRMERKVPGAQVNGKSTSTKPVESPATLKARAVVEVIVELLSLFGFNGKSFKREGEVTAWAAMFENTGDWMKATKWKVAAFYQFHQVSADNLLDTTLPPSPFQDFVSKPGKLLGSTAGRFIRKMLTKGKSRREEFLSSILQLKKGMPRPEESALEASRAKTVKALTSRKKRIEKIMSAPGKHTFGPQNRIRFSTIAQQVKRTTVELFRGRKFNVLRDLLSGNIMPSLSAVNSTSRAKLGMFGWLKENNLLSSDDNYVPLTATLAEPKKRIFDINWSPKTIASMNGIDEVDEPEPDVRPEYVLHGMNGLQDQFVKTYFDTLRVAMTEESTAVAVPLAEALKVRVITKGPPATQYCLKPIQQFMWGVLAKHPVFELIGTPQTAAIVQRAMGRLGVDEGWLSGDYSDATNQLDPRLSNIVWETTCNVCEIPDAIKQLGFRALTGHFILDQGELLVQTWGQLMGSILSFPVLCVVNAAICRMSLEHSRGRFHELSELPLLVNGDDCVFPVNEAGYRFWGLAGEMAGLSPSVGKVYFSPHFLNINSTNYQYRAGSGPASFFRFSETKCINLGLLKGMKRSALTTVEESNEDLVAEGWDSLGSRHTTLMNTSPSSTLFRVHKAFLKANWEKLMPEGVSVGLPWYIPKCYGGLGMKPMKEFGESHSYSKLDARIVTAMVRQPEWLRPGEKERVPKIMRPESMTKIHQVAMEMLHDAIDDPFLEKRWILPDSEERDGFDVPGIDLFVVYLYPELVASDEGAGAEFKKTINHNKRIWSWFQQHVGRFGYLQPFEEILPRKQITLVDISTD